MYPPPHHQSEDIQKMIEVVKQFPLAMLVTASEGTPFITHIPVIYNSESNKLVAHIDRSNPQVASLVNGANATVVFKGPDAYISPSIYTTEQLPTWNYLLVHVTGTIRLLHDPNVAKETMVVMTDFLEAPDYKYQLQKEDPKMDRLVHYIQAFEIENLSWEGKFKLSQDKNPEDFKRAKEALIRKNTESIRNFIETIYR
ncbi:transcriptional regulator [Cochleicola gelatinilyticus]|uniref:Transcriptional regulator n=1 Tax=Cochleicola gelatinilyticus TaxID=1763537 RepID=A0A167IGC7_9FLAO|nr:transcriptional regulator [Cochleicola gelatinilyticus]